MAVTTFQKQAQKLCKNCGHRTLHVAIVKQESQGCSGVLVHLILCVVTLGIWIPIWLLVSGLGMINNAASPMGATWRCQQCGTDPNRAHMLRGFAFIFIAIVVYFVGRQFGLWTLLMQHLDAWAKNK